MNGVTDYKLWPSEDGGALFTDASPVTLGAEFQISGVGWLTEIRFFRPSTSITGTITGRLYVKNSGTSGDAVSGTDVTFTPSGTGWQVAPVSPAVELTPGQRYRVAVHFPANYSKTSNYWDTGSGSSGITTGILSAPSRTSTVAYRSSSTSGTTDGFVASVAVPVPAGSAANDIALVAMEQWTGGGLTNPTVTAPAGFTSLFTQTQGDQHLKVWWKRLTSSESGSWTFTWSGQIWTMAQAILMSGGKKTGDPIGTAFNHASVASGTATPTTTVTGLNFEPFLANLIANENAATQTTVPTGFTEVQDADYLKINYRVPGTTGTFSASGGVLSVDTVQVSGLVAIAPETQGFFVYGSSLAYPVSSDASNYWVDVTISDAPLSVENASGLITGYTTKSLVTTAGSEALATAQASNAAVRLGVPADVAGATADSLMPAAIGVGEGKARGLAQDAIPGVGARSDNIVSASAHDAVVTTIGQPVGHGTADIVVHATTHIVVTHQTIPAFSASALNATVDNGGFAPRRLSGSISFVDRTGGTIATSNTLSGRIKQCAGALTLDGQLSGRIEQP